MKRLKTLSICGLALTSLGSFLPWQREGDLISYLTYGIRIFPSYGIRIFPSIVDNGGLLIVSLSLIVGLLTFNPPRFIKKPLIWKIFFSMGLVIDAAINIVKILFVRARSGGAIGASVIEHGLIMVSLGAIILFLTSLTVYFRYKRVSLPHDPVDL